MVTTNRYLVTDNRNPKIIANPHFWVITALFVVGLLLQYPQQILGTSSPSLFGFLGLSRGTAERVLLLVPVIYTIFAFGKKAGFFSLILAAIIMLPRVFIISQYTPDALVETIGILFTGGLINVLHDTDRREKKSHHEMTAKLESANRELVLRTQTLIEDEKRLATLNQISNAVSHSLDLDQILYEAVNSVAAAVPVDATWICLLNSERTALVPKARLGVIGEFREIKITGSLSGRVAETGKPLFINDIGKDPTLPRASREAIGSALVIPLRLKHNVSGTLGVNLLHGGHLAPAEIDLLTSVGRQIAVAIDNARLFREQQETAADLRQSEQRYRQLFENAHDAIWAHDLEGNLLTVNKAAEKLTGYSAVELKTMNVKSFLAEESIALAKLTRQKLKLGELVEQPYEQRLIRRDGSKAMLKVTSSAIKEGDLTTGFLHIARDVTVEKEMQDKLAVAYDELSEAHRRLRESQEQLIQIEKLTSLGQLAASIAHEVNNPLTGVLVYTQLLTRKIGGEGIPKETALDYLSKMESELIRSTKLIRNLLDFARQSPPDFREVNLNDVINRAYDLAAHTAQMQHIEVAMELSPSLPVLTADFDQLLQVCTNLILNAVQAMAGGGRLTVRTAPINGDVILQVIDTGSGITAENMRKLFTPFFTTKREVKGVGLGLAVSYGIVQRHRGKIEVQSKVGEGTTFTVRLPLRPVKGEAADVPVPAATEGTYASGIHSRGG